MNKSYHIAFYVDPFKKRNLSGKTYQAESILDAIGQYQLDATTPSLDCIKYVSDETNYNYLNSPIHVLNAAKEVLR